MFKKEFQPLSIEKRDSNITTIVAYFRLPRSAVKGVIHLLVERGDVCLEKSSSKRRRLMRASFVLSSKFPLLITKVSTLVSPIRITADASPKP